MSGDETKLAGLPDVELPPILRPAPGDVLFREGNNGEDTARVNCGGNPWEFYAQGYKQAADMLAQQAFETKWS
jgi:hypothetical protein